MALTERKVLVCTGCETGGLTLQEARDHEAKEQGFGHEYRLLPAPEAILRRYGVPENQIGSACKELLEVWG